jgi:quinol monooxygenase YgiN
LPFLASQDLVGLVSRYRRYELWQDIDEADRFTILEEWENEEAHAAHLASGWLQPVIADLMPYSSEPFEMQRLHRTG